MRRTPSLPALLLVLIVGAVAWSIVERRSAPARPPVAEGAAPASPSEAPLHPPPLSVAEACTDAGYLCAEAEQEGSWRALRWPDGTTRLRIRVEAPRHEPPARARELRRAAIRGLDAWQDRPLELVFLRAGYEGPADVRIRWVPVLAESRLGSTQLRWRGNVERQEVTITDFVLATRSPHDRRPLEPGEVELSAAHEMGHALGLPHSDSPRDVMYPENTAARLTARDFQTMEALYRLPNGVEIRR